MFSLIHSSRVPVLLLVFVVVRGVLADQWPQWRGPAGTGVSDETQLPIAWSEQRSVLWKCPLPGAGASTPAVWNDAVFVTSHNEDDKTLLLIRIDKQSGQVRWTRQVAKAETPRDVAKRTSQSFHRLHNLASPSPVTDGQRIVVHFGSGDLAAYDFDGQSLWKRNLQEEFGTFTNWYGRANSPVLHNGLVISTCMQDTQADLRNEPRESYLVAHDVRDGREVWKIERLTRADAEQCDAYTTPLMIEVDGQNQLIVMGANQLDAYDPNSGGLLWKLPGLLGGRTVTSPTTAHSLVYVTYGQSGPMIAVRPKRTARPVELTRRDVVWKLKQGTSDSCTPVVWGSLLFMVSDDGIARCLDAASGHVKWRKRLPGSYKASPIAVDGRIFFLNMDGICTIVSAAIRFDRLTENRLDDETLASPAVSDGRLYIRGRRTLYCIGRVRS